MLELLPRMRSKTIDASVKPDPKIVTKGFDKKFKDDLEKFYKKIDFWNVELDHGENFMHILFRDFDLFNQKNNWREQSYITFE